MESRLSLPTIPASIIRWAPAKVIYPPTVPPIRVRTIIQSILEGSTTSLSAEPTGGCVLKTIYRTKAIIIKPSILVKESIALPSSFREKIRMAIIALMTAPTGKGT